MDLCTPLKAPMTYEQQVAHLKEKHGLVVANTKNACKILSTVNYYRLSAYGIDLLDKETDRFRKGTSIEQLYLLYQFDEKLRNAISPIIEYIEVKFRTAIAYYLSLKYGAECYRDSSCFRSWFSAVKNKDMFEVFNDNVNEEIKRQAKKPMVKHHNQKYGGHFPLWVVVELISLGTLSTLYSLMKSEDQSEIAKLFGTSSKYVKSWFASLVEIRNICAHYGRLYNMPLDSLAKLPPQSQQYANSRLFTDCVAMKYIVREEILWNEFVGNLEFIIKQFPIVNLKCIGFPDDWQDVLQ